MPDKKIPLFLSPKQLAAIGDMSTKAIRTWAETGKIIAMQPAGKGGRWLIPIHRLRLEMLPLDFAYNVKKYIASL